MKAGNIVEIIATGFVAQISRVEGEEIRLHWIGQSMLTFTVTSKEVRLLAEHDKRLADTIPDYARLIEARNVALEKLAETKATKRGVKRVTRRTPIQDAILSATSDEEVLAIIAKFEAEQALQKKKENKV